MKKTYKGKIKFSLISGIIIVMGVIYYNIFCASIYDDYCITFYYNDEFLKPVFVTSIFLFITSIFTFFISDKIFKKWLKFTFWWFLVTIIWVAISPDSVNLLAIPATKENVSIWMSSLFVIVSIIMFIWMTVNEKKNK